MQIFFGNVKCELSAINIFGRGGTKVQIFGKGKCKLIANLSVTVVTSLPSFSLSLSLTSHTIYQKLLEIEKEIVREVARGDQHYVRKSADHKAQISKAFVQLTELICAFRSADFLR